MADRVVYSTERGRMCPDCRQPVAGCACSRKRSHTRADGVVRVSRETKGRKGKCVTLVRGVALDSESLAQLGQSLRVACGTGGTVKEGVIELQGEHVGRVIEQLSHQGWVVKRAGG
ncbi:MAG: translation initiation factor Sui1 [Magnetococcales bacterium]|nr:translation initiation factor Sui1 [Magnetococcales bacterium]MBF0321988.1 translation initiation factor Sui1 [Magnetococcales bacterium]